MSATAHAICFHGCVSHNRFRTPAAVVADCSVHNIAVTAAGRLTAYCYRCRQPHARMYVRTERAKVVTNSVTHFKLGLFKNVFRPKCAQGAHTGMYVYTEYLLCLSFQYFRVYGLTYFGVATQFERHVINYYMRTPKYKFCRKFEMITRCTHSLTHLC